MAKVVLGVSGGIAAYKAPQLARALTEQGHDVTAVPTPNALRFVGKATLEALTGNAVSVTMWEDVPDVSHVKLGREAELVVVAPATADLLSRAAAGRADDLLTATLLTARCPIVYCPAMHTEMWTHPATQENVEKLRSRGGIVLPPGTGRLTGPDSGAGRLPEPEDIRSLLNLALEGGPEMLEHDLQGRRVLVSAGGTQEPLDPVRHLGNRSSGKQGWALARAAAARGAEVTLVSANVEKDAPFGIRHLRVRTAAELHATMRSEGPGFDMVIMCAAVADHRPREEAATKLKRGGGAILELVENPDILADLASNRGPGQVVVGFAAETGDEGASVMGYARRKLEQKGCDLLVVSDVADGKVFGADRTTVTLLTKVGEQTHHGSKDLIATLVLNAAEGK